MPNGVICLYSSQGLCRCCVICVGLTGESRNVSYCRVGDQVATGPGEEPPLPDLSHYCLPQNYGLCCAINRHCATALALRLSECVHIWTAIQSHIWIQYRVMSGKPHAPAILVPVEAGAVTTSVGSLVDIRAGLGVFEKR